MFQAAVERSHDEIIKALIQWPVASFKTANIVKRLPKTRSGKTLRGTMKKIADGERLSFTRNH
ncbi:MAG: hypothetical protein AAF629_05495 [Chloroflexota bacterium]